MATSVTFLFTDVEGSTELWDRAPASMRPAMARHDEIVGEVVEGHGGTLVRDRAEGDSAFAVFTDAPAAVAAAAELQRRLDAEPWVDGLTIRARAALHTGRADDGADTFYGPLPNRCARLRGIGHGGQILLSSATVEALGSGVPADSSLIELGSHRLKDLTQPEVVHQLVTPGLRRDFPPLRSLDVARHNLPDDAAGIIGRRDERTRLVEALGASRLVTLSGVGGIGKTRLAAAVGAAVVDEHADGVWLVALGDTPASLMGEEIAGVLGVPPVAGRPAVEAISSHLATRSLVLVLDGVDDAGSATAALVHAILAAAPGVRVVLTSRQPLDAPGEAVWPVGPMDPDDAAELFAARAGEHGAALDRDDPAVRAICERLEGLPLAIELIAARVAASSLAEVVGELDSHVRVDLAATLEWAGTKLAPAERVVLRRLSVMAGGFTVEAAEVVAVDDEVPVDEIVDALASLVAMALVSASRSGGTPRFRLLAPVREGGRDEMVRVGEERAVRRRHVAWACDEARGAFRHVEGGDQLAGLDAVAIEHENLRAAIAWAVKGGTADLVLAAHTLVTNLSWFWDKRGDLTEACHWLSRAVAADLEPTRARGESLLRLISALTRVNDLAGAREVAEEAIAVWRQVQLVDPRTGEPPGIGKGDARINIAQAEAGLAEIARLAGDLEAAERHADAALAARRELASPMGVAQSLNLLGMVAYMRGDVGRARAAFDESLELCRAAGDTASVAQLLNNLGVLAMLMADLTGAAEYMADGLELAVELGDRGAQLLLHVNLAAIDLRRGDLASARTRTERSGALCADLGDAVGGARAALVIAEVDRAEGDPAAAHASVETARTMLGDDGDPGLVASALAIEALLALDAGDAVRALRLAGEVEAMDAASGSTAHAADVRSIRIWAAVGEGHAVAAARMVAAAASEVEDADATAIADLADALAAARLDDDPAEALVLVAAAEAVRGAAGLVQPAPERRRRDDVRARALGRLSEADAATAVAAGAALHADDLRARCAR